MHEEGWKIEQRLEALVGIEGGGCIGVEVVVKVRSVDQSGG